MITEHNRALGRLRSWRAGKGRHVVAAWAASQRLCQAVRQGDETACSCGLRWGVNDPDPPKCPRLG